MDVGAVRLWRARIAARGAVLCVLCVAVAGVLLASVAAANTTGNAIKLSGPSSVTYGASIKYTVSGHAHRVRGLYHDYPPNYVIVDVLTSPSSRCPSGPGGASQGNLRPVLRFHSPSVSQVISPFSRTLTVKANGHAYGLCAFLLDSPQGHEYAHAAAYWTVTDVPPPTVMHTLTVSTSGTSGVVDSSDIDCGNGGAHCSHAYAAGTTVTLTEASQPEPPISSTFAGWGGACSGTDMSCTVTMDSDKTVTATFEPTPQ